MTKINDSKRFGNLDSESLNKFELKLSLTLPDDYRIFLLTHNGGNPEPSDVKKIESNVQWIYGIHNGEYWASLEEQINTYKNRIPSKTLPVGNDSFGNIYLLSLRNNSFGQIWFWDHENESDQAADEYFENITKLSSSFSEFLNELYEWISPTETETDKIVRTNDLNSLISLLDNGYNINTEDEYNRTLLENAVIHIKPDLISLLLEKKAELRKSLEIANRNITLFPDEGYDKIIRMLEQNKKGNNTKWKFWKK